MINPERLLASAARIYGEKMNELWGEFLPVPEARLTLVQDGEEIVIGELRFLALYTPGHAEHHCAYLLEEACFSGDIGGVRMPGYHYLRLPFVPPELHLEKWRESLERLRQVHLRYIIPTHFGIFEDVEWHLQNACEQIDLTLRWLEIVMPADPPIEDLRQRFVAWLDGQARAGGLSDKVLQGYQIANPTWMSADGLQRYWRKHRMASGQA
jgi:glyoxylase-like metal-dependent hydrolase (beta-lactamase superfamily II)